MDEQSIVFDFDDIRSAYCAFDTLDELGYRPEIHNNKSVKTQVHIRVENSDITSALEIAQAHRGVYVDNPNGNSNRNEQAYQASEQLEHIPIAAESEQDELSLYTPDERFDHMSADVRI